MAHLPERENFKKSIRRNRAENTPPNPRTLAELQEIPDLYQRTFGGDDFLQYDSKDQIEGGRVLVFATKRNLEILRECDMWFADGTFKVNFFFTKLKLRK